MDTLCEDGCWASFTKMLTYIGLIDTRTIAEWEKMVSIRGVRDYFLSKNVYAFWQEKRKHGQQYGQVNVTSFMHLKMTQYMHD